MASLRSRRSSFQCLCFFELSIIFFFLISVENVSARKPQVVNARSLNERVLGDKIKMLSTTISGNFSKPIHDRVNVTEGKTYNFSYVFSQDEGMTIRVCVTTYSSEKAPLLVVVRQSFSIMSWLVPITFSDTRASYRSVCNTLCPIRNYFKSKPESRREDVFVDFTTNSDVNLDFTLLVSNETDFELETNVPVNVTITPAEPMVFEYDMPKGINSVLVQATSQTNSCMVLAIQDNKCPFFDSERTIEHKGFYQTLTLQSGITVSRKSFKEGKIFVVAILKPTNAECTEGQEIDSHMPRTKTVVLNIMPSITDKDFYIATFGAVGMFLLVYFFSFIISLFMFVRKRRNLPKNFEVENVNIENPNIQSYGSIDSANGEESEDQTRNSVNSISTIEVTRQTSVVSLDETDIDVLEDAENDKDVVRTKTVLYVSDLARKKEKHLKERTKIYSWNLLTIAVFYGLPVVQLVYTNQKIVNMTGNQDLCYYNFLCSHKFWVFSDFNHVFSNIGYIMLGILFLLLVWRKESLNFNFENGSSGGSDCSVTTGIPHHYGMFYAMGWALVMEGILSGSYHVCPNKANFQFDTAFMYIISTVCMLKLYQARHPDITAKSHSTWMLLSIVIFIGVIGVLQGGTAFWIIFAIAHLITTFILSATIYYMGRWKLDRWIFKRVYQTIIHDLGSGSFRPIYPGRFIMLGITVILNTAWDIVGLVKRPENFASFLLAIFIMNLMLYLIYYTVMKVRYKEHIRWIPWMYIVLSFVSWGTALHYFLQKNTSWQMTPALSRERNKLCVILEFYDDHDIWHFVSSFALFFSYMVLFTLDDDLEMASRRTIAVF